MRQSSFFPFIAPCVAMLAAVLLIGTTEVKSAEPSSTHKDLQLNPQPSPEMLSQFGNMKVPPPGCSSPLVAFSVWDQQYGTSGADVVLPYNHVVTNQTYGGWPTIANASVFTVPCAGYYFFTISFVKDAFGLCGGTLGTTDDVTMYLTKNGTAVGGAQAWAGESNAKRAAGVFSVVLQLAVGDQVVSWVHSDGGLFRCMASYNLTGYRVGI